MERVKFFNKFLRKEILALTLTLTFLLASCGGGKEIKTAPEGQRKAAALINQGHKYYIDGNLSKALGYYKNALDLSHTIDFQEGVVKGLNGIGNIEHVNGDDEEAMKDFQTAINISEKLNNKILLSDSIGNAGNIYA